MVRYEKCEKIDAINEYLTHIKKIEGMSKEDYLEKISNTVIEKKPESDTKHEDSKKARSLLFASDRFKLNNSYKMDKEITCKNLLNFINDSEAERIPRYCHCHRLKKRIAQKIVADDFEEIVYKSKKNVVVLLESAQSGKEKKFREIYENIAERSLNSKHTIYGRYNVVNESQVFQYKGMTPSIAVFTVNNKDKPIYLNLLEVEKEVKGKHDIEDRIMDFIEKNVKII